MCGKHIDDKITSSLKELLTVDRLLAEPQLQAMSTLYDIIMAPLVGDLETIKNVIISPDSIFSLVPFNALQGPYGKFLIEHITLFQIATGRQLVSGKKDYPEKQNIPTVIADPDFDANVKKHVDTQSKNGQIIPSKPLGRL